jgi:glycosyltransferase involved in cell wall biosynthesis
MIAREIIGLPKDRKLVLFGAFAALEDKNKGFSHLVRALEVLKSNGQSHGIDLILFGSRKSLSIPDLPVPYRCLGTFYDEISLALVYSSVDVFVIPSEQENFPNTILEAAACGIPSVAFSVGGIPELIIHKKTGYLAHSFDCSELAAGIQWVLEDQNRYDVLSNNARENVTNYYTLDIMARQYLQLYEKALSNR